MSEGREHLLYLSTNMTDLYLIFSLQSISTIKILMLVIAMTLYLQYCNVTTNIIRSLSIVIISL